jgi:hypothetical protein
MAEKATRDWDDASTPDLTRIRRFACEIEIEVKGIGGRWPRGWRFSTKADVIFAGESFLAIERTDARDEPTFLGAIVPEEIHDALLLRGTILLSAFVGNEKRTVELPLIRDENGLRIGDLEFEAFDFGETPPGK